MKWERILVKVGERGTLQTGKYFLQLFQNISCHNTKLCLFDQKPTSTMLMVAGRKVNDAENEDSVVDSDNDEDYSDDWGVDGVEDDEAEELGVAT